MTFKTTIDFIGDLTKKLSDMLTGEDNVLKISESVSSEVDENKSQLNGSTEVYVSQMKMLSSISVEISGFQKRSNTSSLYKTWREKEEIYTSENNFTFCFGMEDCIATALTSLESLPLVSPDQMMKYKSNILKLKDLSISLLDYGKDELNFRNLTEITQCILQLLHLLNKTSLHCSKAPILKPTQNTEFFIHTGQMIKTKCGDVVSALPVKYSWKLHDIFIDGAFTNELIIKDASLDKSGVYTCLLYTSPSPRDS